MHGTLHLDLTADRLREVLAYDAATGIFTRKTSTGRRWKAGLVAGTVARSRYVVIQVDGVLYQAHRLAWLYVHGEWPPEIIDHINGDRTDNRLENLRCATNALNKANSRLRRDNSSGFKGVYAAGRWWRAQIRVNGHILHIGRFASKEAAHAAYMSEARKHFGEFARAA
jgi:hypothetical protein